MYLFLLVMALVVMIVLIFFIVVIGLKACSFLDALAKKAELEDFKDGFPFDGSVFQKPNRTKQRFGIRDKLRKRNERFKI